MHKSGWIGDKYKERWKCPVYLSPIIKGMGITYPQRMGISIPGYPQAKRNGDKLSQLVVDKLFISTAETVGRFIVSGNAGTFTHFDGVVHISCRFIHLIHIFLYSTAIKAFY